MLWASFDSIAAPFPPALARALSKQIDVSGIESVRKADWNRYYPVPQLRQSEVLLSLWGEASAYICVLVRSHLARKSYRVLRKTYGG